MKSFGQLYKVAKNYLELISGEVQDPLDDLYQAVKAAEAEVEFFKQLGIDVLDEEFQPALHWMPKLDMITYVTQDGHVAEPITPQHDVDILWNNDQTKIVGFQIWSPLNYLKAHIENVVKDSTKREALLKFLNEQN